MKRRSARPFMVEVKGTRTARASLNAPTLRTRPDTNLWHELAELDAKPPQPEIQAPAPSRPERKEAEAPVRRVLPSLVPMFEIAAESESEPEVAAPPVRRSRTRSERTPVDVQAAISTPAPKPVAKPVPKSRQVTARPMPTHELPVSAPAPVQATTPAPAAGPAEGPSQRPAGWRRTKELRLGERWKRRLPQFAR